MTLPSPGTGWAATEVPAVGVAGAALVAAGEGAVATLVAPGAGAAAEAAFVAGVVTAVADGAAACPVTRSAIWISAPSEGRYEARTRKGEWLAPGSFMVEGGAGAEFVSGAAGAGAELVSGATGAAGETGASVLSGVGVGAGAGAVVELAGPDAVRVAPWTPNFSRSASKRFSICAWVTSK